MLRMEQGPPHVVLLDLTSQVTSDHADMAVVTGSYGGVSAAYSARAMAARLYAFTDAGAGKDEAGIASDCGQVPR